MGTSYRLTIAFVGVTLTSLAMAVPVTEQAAQLDLTSEALVLSSGQFACPVGMVDATLTKTGPPDWVDAVSTSAWTEVSASENYKTWADVALAPVSGAYLGGGGTVGAISAIRDAFSQYACDPAGKDFYHWGGGHNDGSCNAVVKFDLETLTHSVVVPATPPTSYPPSMTAADSPLIYPSGFNGYSFFKTAAQLTDPADTPYGAPFEARRSSHSYGSITFYNGLLQTHYSACGDADVSAGDWSYLEENPYGPQVFAENVNYENKILPINMVSLVDRVLGKVWCTFHPGDNATAWRSHLLRIEPSTRTIEQYVSLPSLNGRESGCISGRYLWLTGVTIASGTATADRIWRLDMDTSAVTHYTVSGAAASWTDGASTQECTPTFHNGSHLYQWAFVGDKDALAQVDVDNPTSGAGTLASPYVVPATRVALGASGIGTVSLTYHLDYIEEWGVAVILPRANAKLWALKI